MAKLKKAAKKQATVGYVVWSITDHSIVDDCSFDTRGEAESYVEDGLKHDDFNADEVVICELVPRCRPEAPVTEVQWKEIEA